MTSEEFKAWAKHQKNNAGHWVVDGIHSKDDDFLCYNSYPDDPTGGVYVEIRHNVLSCGRFEGAIPHIGDAIFRPKRKIECESNRDAWEKALDRLGLNFLMALTHGSSMYPGL